MQCPYCHADGQEGSFCEKCGKPLDNAGASDLTRVMPPLHETIPEDTQPTDEESPTADDAAQENAEGEENTEPPLADAGDTESADAEDAEKKETALALPSFLLEDDEEEQDALKNAEEETPDQKRKRKILTALALVIGIVLAAVAAVYLFTDMFGTAGKDDPTEALKAAEAVAPDTNLPEDTIVGHWRNYNKGSVIEKIGAGQYRWTIGKDVYDLKFADNQYTVTDENGNTYVFVLSDADHIKLTSSKDSAGGLISDPVFPADYVAGRVGQDGTMAKSMTVNTEAFNIVGKTYAELAGTYGPGSLTVIGDNQYILFRGEGGNFAVQFEGDTVPLSAEGESDIQTTPLSYTGGYRITRVTAQVTYPTTDTSGTTTGSGDTTTTTTPDNSTTTTTTPDTSTNTSNTQPSTDSNSSDSEKEKKYTVEIPDMPTFPSTSAVATGVVWAELGFVINNAPDTLTVDNLSAVLGIALEVGTAPANESGFNFYGSDEGYFAGTYTSGEHSFYISGYGNSSLSPDKTILFIEQIS